MPGSSPLARGLPVGLSDVVIDCRIIPARAGFTSTTLSWAAILADHPRSRGVYRGLINSDDAAAGSSPLARGLRLEGAGPPHRPGIIPARAGFTHSDNKERRANKDHPRSRGVYTREPGALCNAGGSSPLARGLRAAAAGRGRGHGIIPARAGFTRPLLRRPRRAPDHPRSRGVYIMRKTGRARYAGSSPLARGLRAVPVGGSAHSRIIPARAGFTAPP